MFKWLFRKTISAHFGFAPDGSALPDANLPANLVAEWRADEANEGQPFPTCAVQLSARGTAAAESRYSWTMDFAARRAKAREEMQPLVDQAAALRGANSVNADLRSSD